MSRPRYISARNNLSKETRQRVYSFDDWTCVYCGSQENLSLDHIIPLSLCASRWFVEVVNHQTNLVTACFPCNLKRNMGEHGMMRFGRFFACPTDVEVYVKRTEAALDTLQEYFLKHHRRRVERWEKRMRKLDGFQA